MTELPDSKELLIVDQNPAIEDEKSDAIIGDAAIVELPESTGESPDDTVPPMTTPDNILQTNDKSTIFRPDDILQTIKKYHNVRIDDAKRTLK